MSVFTPPSRLLFGPGPSQIPERVYQAMAQPIVGHLDPFLFEQFEHIRAALRDLFGTKNQFVHALSGTGSAGMEASLSNFVAPGQKLAVFSAGYFSERIIDMGKRHGATVVVANKPWGETFTEAEATDFLNREKPQVAAFVHAETSTGALQEPKAITASPAAIERLRARTTPCPIWYLDYALLLEYYEGSHRYHHTAPVSSIYALREGLAAITEEGVDARFARHQKMHEYFVKRIEKEGWRLLVPPGRRIPNLNTMCVPDGVDDPKTRARLLKEKGIEISGGFGPLAGKIFRIGIMGPLATEKNVDLLVDALLACMKE